MDTSPDLTNHPPVPEPRIYNSIDDLPGQWQVLIRMMEQKSGIRFLSMIVHADGTFEIALMDPETQQVTIAADPTRETWIDMNIGIEGFPLEQLQERKNLYDRVLTWIVKNIPNHGENFEFHDGLLTNFPKAPNRLTLTYRNEVEGQTLYIYVDLTSEEVIGHDILDEDIFA